MNRLPSLAALRAFECVARNGSFTKAADELCVTIPALSHHIKALELELGQKLFIRLHRAIKLTDPGRTLFVSAEQAFATLEETWTGLGNSPKMFKLSSGIHFMTNWLAPRSARFQSAVTGYEIDHITTFDQLSLDAGEVDLAIRNGDQLIRNLHSETIYQEWWAPMVAPEVAKKLKEPSDLLKCPIIEARHSRERQRQPCLEDWLIAVGVQEKPKDVQSITHTETAMQMAVEGSHVKLCASIQSGELHRQGKLVIPFPTAIRRKGIRFYVVCRSGEEEMKPIPAIRSFFKNEFAAMDKAMEFDKMSLIELPEV